MSEAELEFVAHAALAGIEPIQFFKVEDELEMHALRLVAMKAIELNKKYREDLAALIISKLAKSLEKGSRRSRVSQNTTPTRN